MQSQKDRFAFFPKIENGDKKPRGLTSSASDSVLFLSSPSSSIASHKLRKVDSSFDANVIKETIKAHRDGKQKAKHRLHTEQQVFASAEARLATMSKTMYMGKGWALDKEIRRIRSAESWTPSRAKAKELLHSSTVQGLRDIRYTQAMLVLQDRRHRHRIREQKKRALEAATRQKQMDDMTKRHLDEMEEMHQKQDGDDELDERERERRARLTAIKALDMSKFGSKDKDMVNYSDVMSDTQRERIVHVDSLFKFIRAEKELNNRKVARAKRNVEIAERDIVVHHQSRLRRVRALFRNFNKALVIFLVIQTDSRRRRQKKMASDKKILLAFRDDEEKRQKDQERRRKHADAIQRYKQRKAEEERQKAWMEELKEREKKQLAKRLRRQLRAKFRALEKKRRNAKLGNLMVKVHGLRNFLLLTHMPRPCLVLQVGYIAPALPVLTFYSKVIPTTSEWTQLSQTFHFPIKNAEMQHLSFSIVNKPTRKDLMHELTRLGIMGLAEADNLPKPQSAGQDGGEGGGAAPAEEAAAAVQEAKEAEAEAEEEKNGQQQAFTHLSKFESDIKIQLHAIRDQRLGAVEREIDLNFNKRIAAGENIELFPPPVEEVEEEDDADSDEDGKKGDGTKRDKAKKTTKGTTKKEKKPKVVVEPEKTNVRAVLKDKKHDGTVHFEIRLIPVFGPTVYRRRVDDSESDDDDGHTHIRAPIAVRFLSKNNVLTYAKPGHRRFDQYPCGLLGT